MFQRMPALVLATQAFLTAMAGAQTPPPPTPQAPSVLTYRSALDGYQSFTDEKLAPWKESNDNVGGIGGWRVYAKEAAERDAAPNAASASAASAAKGPASVATPDPAAMPSKPAARPSGGHGKH